MNTTTQTPLELWGGVECTINRVGDRFFTQLERNGHRTRLRDLELFADLGLRALRFPILWEELAPASLDEIDWSPIDAQLAKMRELGIRPIAGLVHHGSGPRHTSLIDPRFPEKLAAFASRVAARYPWIEAYTPVNEPLTTARFTGLYGHWYPHGRDGFTFVRALLNQCRAVVLSMRAAREVNPAAALVQTDDLGKTFSSPKLQYQADFENERRWISWDLLCGRVDREHPMWDYLLALGAEERDVAFFLENPCPPDVIGVNHYITSERHLDENLRDHPPATHGGNGRDRYADRTAVRVRAEGIAGPETLLRETCERYGTAVAVTEAHLGCTRDEQLRWLGEIWSAAQTLRADGHDVRAVTAWSLLGAFDWNSLLTRADDSYESGVFDLRGGSPRPTALATMLKSLATTGAFDHPVLQTPGWWRRPVRLLPPHRPQDENAVAIEPVCPSGDVRSHAFASQAAPPRPRRTRPILITGAGGRLGRGFRAAAELRALEHRTFNHVDLDVSDRGAVKAAIEELRPWAVINCAGFARIDDAEDNERACARANVDGAENLARACAAANVPLVTFSSDHVFDGSKRAPYLESDPCHALSVYGRTKIAAERKVLAAGGKALIVRSGKVLAPLEENDFLLSSLRRIAAGERVQVAHDLRLSATFLPDLVNAALDLLIDGETGVWHLANAGVVTPRDLLLAAAEISKLDADLIEGVPFWSLHRAADRPRYRALESERAPLLPPLADALQRYCTDAARAILELDAAVAVR